jgi:hypothetical protein
MPDTLYNEMDETFLTQMEQEISQVRTKYCERILNLLEEEGTLYHGDLAKKLSLSPSGLNAIIRKMMEPNNLIHIDDVGKYKIYSLSDDMKNYFRLKKQAHIVPISDSRERQGLFLPLQHFAACAGKQWMDALNVCLTGENAEESQEVKDAFDVFIRQVEKMNDYERNQIEQILENDILIRVLRMYLAESIEDQHAQ